MDALEGAPRGATAEHLASCAECMARVAEAREGLVLTRAATLPEPPALYWESFPRQVARRLDEPAASRSWRLWLLPGAAATVMAVIAVLSFLPRPAPERTPPPRTLAAWSALPAAEEDPGLPVLQALGPDLAPAVECSGVADCLADLSDEETQALARTLRPDVKASLL
jgi:hypothetical protein